ncbi:hypothetical protein AB0D66_25650 [Streptomyces sp. NPDC048270]|uniref:hypothetical protein n=1 Tax=Streptomyces sp. NPDC048270 TaxID=3154615 RepID=UPI0033FA1F19
MTEIIAALIGGVCALGAAVVTVRWARSRSTDSVTADQLPPASDAQLGNAANTAPGATGATPSDGVTINAPHSGQIIGTNNGTVSQTNYRDGKR